MNKSGKHLSYLDKMFYIHDMTTTLISNSWIVKYLSENQIDLNAIPLDFKEYLLCNSNKKTEVVVIQCYEYTEDVVEQNHKHLITVIGQTYTHYVEDKCGGFELSKCGSDEFDFLRQQFIKRRYRKEQYYSEQESNRRVLELFQRGGKVCGNSHKFINEFCYNLYERYLDVTNFKGRLIKISSGYHFPLLMNKSFVETEIVVFGGADSLIAIDDSNIKQYSYEHKTLSFDIETVLVDKDGNRIQDTIIQISFVYQEGSSLKRYIGVTIGDAITDSTFYNFENLTGHFDNRDLPDVEIICVKNERQIIETFKEIIHDVKPDYISGYNVIGFDLQILLKVADRYNIDLIEDLSHIKGFEMNKSNILRYLSTFKQRQNVKGQNKEATFSLLENNHVFDLNCHIFSGMLINDLYRCHKGEKLNELANAALGIGKEDVSYSEIPTLFYSSNILDKSRLLKYNIVDSLLVGALINTSDNFSSYKFFITSSYAAKVPHSEFFNLQKTPLLAPMFYYAFKKKGMLQEMKIKPLKESDKMCVSELLMYYLYHKHTVTYWLTSEVIEKMNSGEIKTKTILKHLNLSKEYGHLKSIDFVTALEVLKRQLCVAKEKNTKHGKKCYTLTHLMLYLRLLTEECENSYDTNQLIDRYYCDNFLGKYAKVNTSITKTKNKLLMEEEESRMTTEIMAFIKYLSRRTISSTHTITQLANSYIEHELIDIKFKSRIRHFAVYINNGNSGILQKSLLNLLEQYNDSKGFQRFTDRYTPETFCNEVVNIIFDNLLMKFDTPSKYDGAYVCVPEPGIEKEYPICCLDYSSMYPCIGISHNMGPETIVTQKIIKLFGLKEGLDYDKVNLYSRDDHRLVNIETLSSHESNNNYVCFLKQKYCKSVFSEVWQRILDNRLHFKRQIGTFAEVEENRRVTEMSDTFKISANSVYGVLPYMGQWKISAAITSRGRQNIQNVAKEIENSRRGITVYGDTDSVMFHFQLTTDQLCSLYKNGELFNRGWIKDKYISQISTLEKDSYKQGCLIAAEMSKCIADNLNNRYLDNPKEAIHFPPSKLEHEKVMLPFIIFNQKHYFAKVMDKIGDEKFLLKGLECCKRTKLCATEEIEQVMFSDLLRSNPCTWSTYRLSCDIVRQLIHDTYDLKKICSRKKITISSNRLLKAESDAGVQLYQRMKQRGEITDTGGLDKINVMVIKVINFENKNKVKYESLDYLTKLQHENKPLNLDTKAIVRQILREVVTIMEVIHPQSTFEYFSDLLHLKVSDTASEFSFTKFVKPRAEKIEKNLLQNDKVRSTSGLTKTLYNYFPIRNKSPASKKRKADQID